MHSAKDFKTSEVTQLKLTVTKYKLSQSKLETTKNRKIQILAILKQQVYQM